MSERTKKTVRLEGGKYEFDIDETLGLLVAARRHKVDWPAGLELRFTNCFVAALLRILELEANARRGSVPVDDPEFA